MEQTIVKQILDKWATIVVPKEAIFLREGEPQVNQKKCDYYDQIGYNKDLVLWIPPPNCIRIEFEDTPEHNKRYMSELESAAKAKEIDYCITGHKGKSDYFNMFNIKDIPLTDDNRAAKLLLIDSIVSKRAKDFLDRTNLGWTLSPIIDHPHWKPKYNGEIHKILRGKNPIEHENKYPKELLKQLKKTKEWHSKYNTETKVTAGWVEDFLINFCCNNELPKGSRHFVIEKNLAAMIIFRKDKDEIKNRYLKAQGRKIDTLRSWELSILKGDYTKISSNELKKYIVDYDLDFNVPIEKPKTESIDGKPDFLKVDNYLDNAQIFYSKQPYFFDKSKLWWMWNDNRWCVVDDVDMTSLLDDKLGFMGQTINATIRNNHIAAMQWVGRRNKPKDAPIKWIQFKDKAFSLTSKKIYDVTPDYFFCNPIPWEIGDNDKTPVMDRLFKEWVGKKYIQTLYEIIAYCCYNSYPIHLIFCLIGSGRNGKSSFLSLLSNFLGRQNICSTELDTLLNSRFESFKLFKKSACTMGETNFGVLEKTSLLKKLCGQDLIGYEYKNKLPFDDYNYAKIIVSSNSLPSSLDTSEGFYRRWYILDFPNTFPEGKEILKEIPEQEYNNLCKKVCNILPGLIEKGEFTHQGSIDWRKEKYILASNPLSLFIKESCNREENSFMRYSELYTKYTTYLVKHKKRKISRKEFSGVLEEEGLEVVRTSKKIGDEWVNGSFIDGLEMKTSDDLIIITKTGRFIRIDKYFGACKKCGETNSNGWTLENQEDKSIWCDVCAEVL